MANDEQDFSPPTAFTADSIEKVPSSGVATTKDLSVSEDYGRVSGAPAGDRPQLLALLPSLPHEPRHELAVGVWAYSSAPSAVRFVAVVLAVLSTWLAFALDAAASRVLANSAASPLLGLGLPSLLVVASHAVFWWRARRSGLFDPIDALSSALQLVALAVAIAAGPALAWALVAAQLVLHLGRDSFDRAWLLSKPAYARALVATFVLGVVVPVASIGLLGIGTARMLDSEWRALLASLGESRCAYVDDEERRPIGAFFVHIFESDRTALEQRLAACVSGAIARVGEGDSWTPLAAAIDGSPGGRFLSELTESDHNRRLLERWTTLRLRLETRVAPLAEALGAGFADRLRASLERVTSDGICANPFLWPERALLLTATGRLPAGACARPEDLGADSVLREAAVVLQPLTSAPVLARGEPVPASLATVFRRRASSKEDRTSTFDSTTLLLPREGRLSRLLVVRGRVDDRTDRRPAKSRQAAVAREAEPAWFGIYGDGDAKTSDRLLQEFTTSARAKWGTIAYERGRCAAHPRATVLRASESSESGGDAADAGTPTWLLLNVQSDAANGLRLLTATAFSRNPCR